MSKTRLSFSSLSLKWFLLGFDTLTIMHTNSSFFLSDLHFCPPPACVVRKMTTLNADDDVDEKRDFDDDEKEEEKDEKI